jgi:NhaA family Na+:H+ antiporter
VAVGLLLPPGGTLERRLHGWVAFGIMPLFALANAGVPIAGLPGGGTRVLAGVGLGLLLGKPLGILAATALARRLGLVELPEGVGWRALLVLGLVAGMGFTMGLFVAALAFPPGPMLETAKIAVLAGSTLAAVAGLAAGRALLR